MVSFELIVGKNLNKYIGEISNLRKMQFQYPPYSYAFNDAYENEYINKYASNEDSMCIIAKKDNLIIDLITGQPLDAGGAIISETKINIASIGYQTNEFFYICEVIVRPEYRKIGIGKKLMMEIEKFALLKNKKFMSLLTIADNNKDHKPIFWKNIGYQKTNLYETHHWPTYTNDGDIKETSHKLVYWMKTLAQVDS